MTARIRLAGILAVATVASLSRQLTAQPPATGGFIEAATSTAVRPLLSASQIQSLLPARGAFVFPAPYLTQGIRITNATDCGGADCVDYVGYSYWPFSRRMPVHSNPDVSWWRASLSL